MWNIRVRGPGGRQVVLKIHPEANFKALSQLASKELGLKTHDSLTFRKGFPPRPVEVDSLALVKSVFEPNDTIVVDRTPDTTSSTISASTSSAAKKTRRLKTATTKKPIDKVSKGGVHTLYPSTSVKKNAPPKRKLPGPGHQLGSSFENYLAKPVDVKDDDQGAPQRKFRRSKAINLTSKEDVETSLVNAVSGQSHDRAAKFFRAATKNAVAHQYELTLATARLNAALARKCETEELLTVRRADGSAAKLRVRFKETPRKWKEETVDLLKPNELQAILKYVLLSGGETGREMLKPFNMAQVSTRVFWSIAHMYDGDVAAGLADLVPDEDWSFIDTRTRVLSEKAMEAKTNEEEYKLWKQKKQGNSRSSRASTSNPEIKETKSIERLAKQTTPDVTSVNSSKDEGTSQEPKTLQQTLSAQTPALTAKEATPGTLRTAAARAASTRLDRSAQTNAIVSAFQEVKESSIKKHVEPDESVFESDGEVEEATTVYCDTCEKARILSLEEAANAELEKDPWTCLCLKRTGRSGGCDAVDDEVAQITGVAIAEWLQKAFVTTRRQLADASVGATTHLLVDPLDPSAQMVQNKLEKLIDEARLDEVNDWMAELVGDANVMERLELQKLGTPADIVVTPCDLIFKAVGNSANISLEVVRCWQTRANCLMKEHPWLVEWRTL